MSGIDEDQVGLTGQSGFLVSSDLTGGDGSRITSLRSNLFASAAPTGAASFAAGYRIGSIWIWGARIWICYGDALWLEVAPVGHSHDAAAITTGALAIARGGTGVTTGLTALNASNLTTGTAPLARGGTGANLSATGGSGQVVKQLTAGGALTVAALTAAELPTHNHSASQVTSGTLPIARGGTGAGTAPAALANLINVANWSQADIDAISVLLSGGLAIDQNEVLAALGGTTPIALTGIFSQPTYAVEISDPSVSATFTKVSNTSATLSVAAPGSVALSPLTFEIANDSIDVYLANVGLAESRLYAVVGQVNTIELTGGPFGEFTQVATTTGAPIALTVNSSSSATVTLNLTAHSAVANYTLTVSAGTLSVTIPLSTTSYAVGTWLDLRSSGPSLTIGTADTDDLQIDGLTALSRETDYLTHTGGSATPTANAIRVNKLRYPRGAGVACEWLVRGDWASYLTPGGNRSWYLGVGSPDSSIAGNVVSYAEYMFYSRANNPNEVREIHASTGTPGSSVSEQPASGFSNSGDSNWFRFQFTDSGLSLTRLTSLSDWGAAGAAADSWGLPAGAAPAQSVLSPLVAPSQAAGVRFVGVRLVRV